MKIQIPSPLIRATLRLICKYVLCSFLSNKINNENDSSEKTVVKAS